MEEIYKRRSIRKYSDRFISDNDVNKILKAGMNAPTARNLKPYEFVVIRDKNILLKLADMKKMHILLEVAMFVLHYLDMN